MIEKPAVMILSEPGEISNNCDSGVETISFEPDILGEPVCFSIRVAQKQAKLSDIAPLARTLSTKIALVVLDRLRRNGGICSLLQRLLDVLQLPDSPVGSRGLSPQRRGVGHAGRARKRGIAIMS